jgi:hypothetical protein
MFGLFDIEGKCGKLWKGEVRTKQLTENCGKEKLLWDEGFYCIIEKSSIKCKKM